MQFIVWENKYDDSTLPDILNGLSDLSTLQSSAAKELTDYWTTYHASNPETDIPNDTSVSLPGFDVQTIRAFIDQNLTVSDPYSDEAFCVSITEAYIADPTAFGDMISDLSNDDIQRLGGQIAYTIENNPVDTTLPTAQNGSESAALLTLQRAIAEVEAPPRTNVDVDGIHTFPKPLYLLIPSAIGDISYSGGLEAHKAVALSVKQLQGC